MALAPREGENAFVWRTTTAMERVLRGQLLHADFQGRGFKRWQRALPLVRRIRKNPVDLHDWNHGILHQGQVALSRRGGAASIEWR